VAAAQPLAISPAAAPAASVPGAADAAPVSGFAVQLGVSPSEADARTTLQRLQQKFPDLGGATPLIRRAEVNGNTIFRVRVGPMSREDASSLCSRVQGQGGQCFVAKN
jgi:cell division septation protein DedD